MKKEYEFTLVRAARSQGGDRYEHGKKGEPEFMVFYFPQAISRESGKVKDKLTITISD